MTKKCDQLVMFGECLGVISNISGWERSDRGIPVDLTPSFIDWFQRSEEDLCHFLAGSASGLPQVWDSMCIVTGWQRASSPIPATSVASHWPIPVKPRRSRWSGNVTQANRLLKNNRGKIP